jgi:hypothetical protein
LRIPKPSPEELLQKFEELDKSKARTAHHYRRTPQTVHRWLRELNAVPELPSDAADKIRYDAFVEKRERQLKDDEEPEVTAGVYEEKSLLPGVGFKPPKLLDEDCAAFDRLSPRQQKAVTLLGSSQPEHIALTNEELCEELKIAVVTLQTWKKNPIFQSALKEYSVPEFQSEALSSLQRRLLTLTRTQKDRPEDRRLLAQITGLVDGDGVTANVQVNLATDLGKRWQ